MLLKQQKILLNNLKYLNNAAIVTRYTNNTEQAEKYIQKALSILEIAPHKAIEASIYNTLGMLALSQKRLSIG